MQKFHLDDADIALVAYGSEARPALDAALLAREKGIKAGVLKLDVPWPFPEEEIAGLASAMGAIITVEMNIGRYAAEIERAACGKCRTARATKNLGSRIRPVKYLPS